MISRVFIRHCTVITILLTIFPMLCTFPLTFLFTIILFLAALGLCCCARAFSRGAVRASHGGGFSCCAAWALGAQASVFAACGLSRGGTGLAGECSSPQGEPSGAPCVSGREGMAMNMHLCLTVTFLMPRFFLTFNFPLQI